MSIMEKGLGKQFQALNVKIHVSLVDTLFPCPKTCHYSASGMTILLMEVINNVKKCPKRKTIKFHGFF